jgi:hypothetical protein
MITVATFKTKVAPKLHGTTLAKVAGVYEKMAEAGGNLFSFVKPYTVIKRARIENAIYDKVFNYACEDDCEVNGILDIRPVGERSTKDSLQGSFSQQFDIKKKENTFVVEYINGVKTLRLSKILTPRSILSEMDSLTIGQTITGSGDVTNLDLDYQDHISGSSAVSFDLTGATGQGVIDITLANSIDLSTLEGMGAMFAWLKFPLSTALTSVRLRFGSNSTNYIEQTVSTAHDRPFESQAWVLLKQLFSSSTTTGTPDYTAIQYIQIAINYTAGTARADIKLDNITASLGEAWEVVYYSNRLFTDSTSTVWKEVPTSDTDIIRLDGSLDANTYLYLFMQTLQQEIKGKNMTTDFSFFKTQLGNGEETGLLYEMKQKYPDQTIKRQVDYYDFENLDGYGGGNSWDSDEDNNNW